MRNAIHPQAGKLPGIVLASSDYERLLDLTEESDSLAPHVATYLARELQRAEVVGDADLDGEIARVGSRVIYSEDEGGRERAVTLAWPHDADLQQQRISVLTSIGAALLGLRAGQSIDWSPPLGGPRTLTVLAVRDAAPAQPAV